MSSPSGNDTAPPDDVRTGLWMALFYGAVGPLPIAPVIYLLLEITGAWAELFGNLIGSVLIAYMGGFLPLAAVGFLIGFRSTVPRPDGGRRLASRASLLCGAVAGLFFSSSPSMSPEVSLLPAVALGAVLCAIGAVMCTAIVGLPRTIMTEKDRL